MVEIRSNNNIVYRCAYHAVIKEYVANQKDK